jgi:hypothetical protein
LKISSFFLSHFLVGISAFIFLLIELFLLRSFTSSRQRHCVGGDGGGGDAP